MSDLQKLLDAWKALDELPQLCNVCDCAVGAGCYPKELKRSIADWLKRYHDIEPYTEESQ